MFAQPQLSSSHCLHIKVAIHTCPTSGYSTKQSGNYNHHRSQYRGCQRKLTEMCARCARKFKLNGSGLRKHRCLAVNVQPFDHNAFDDGPLVFGLQQLRFLSKSHLKQLGFADPVQVATAAVKYLHLNSVFPQWQNVSVCQFDADKLDIVDDDCGRHPVPLWVAKPKAIVLEELLDEVAGVLEGLAQAVPCKLPKRQVEGLGYFTRHVLQRCQNQYEDTFRRQRPELVQKQLVVCDGICGLLSL